MRKQFYPKYTDWQAAVISATNTALKSMPLEGINVWGADDSLRIGVDDRDNEAHAMPFVRVVLSGVGEGWEPQHGNDYGGYDYQTVGTGKSLQSRKAYTEQLAFTIEMVANRQDHIVAVVEAIRKYFSPRGKLRITWNGETVEANYRLGDYALQLQETGTAHIESYVAEWVLTLDITSESTAPDTIVVPITGHSTTLTAELDGYKSPVAKTAI